MGNCLSALLGGAQRSGTSEGGRGLLTLFWVGPHPLGASASSAALKAVQTWVVGRVGLCGGGEYWVLGPPGRTGVDSARAPSRLTEWGRLAVPGPSG